MSDDKCYNLGYGVIENFQLLWENPDPDNWSSEKIIEILENRFDLFILVYKVTYSVGAIEGERLTSVIVSLASSNTLHSKYSVNTFFERVRSSGSYEMKVYRIENEDHSVKTVFECSKPGVSRVHRPLYIYGIR